MQRISNEHIGTVIWLVTRPVAQPQEFGSFVLNLPQFWAPETGPQMSPRTPRMEQTSQCIRSVLILRFNTTPLNPHAHDVQAGATGRACCEGTHAERTLSAAAEPGTG